MKKTSTSKQKGERLQKVLARAGFGSRREIEKWIEQGLVLVNNEAAKLGDCYSPGDTLKVNGKPVSSSRLGAQDERVIIYHKPLGEVCTRQDEEGRPTVFQNLPFVKNGRWISVGRLDINTSGLLIFTTDGELANQLMHPSSEVEREYAVRVLGDVDPLILKKLRDGVVLDDGPAKFDTIRDAGGAGANHWYHVTLKEGRNREVRRLWESQGVLVSRLIRVRYGNVTLPKGLKQGTWRELENHFVTELRAIAANKKPLPLTS